MLIAGVSELINQAWNDIGFFLDKAVYGLISFLYNLFHNIASVRLLNSTMLDGFKKRVYLIIAVVSLFIIIYSLLQIIVNPDKGASGEYSAAKVVFNLVKSTILILIVPTLFSFAFRFQASVMKKNFIVRLVTGRYTEAEDAGSQFTVPVFEGFFYLNSNGEANEDAVELFNRAEKESLRNGDIDAFGNFFHNNDYSEGGTVYDDENDQTVTYKFPLSTIAGCFVAYVLLIYCFDIAVRSVKLAFLEVVSPFPILISIIPKQDKIFNNWLKNTFKTYFELFLRIFVLSLGVYLISLLPNMLDTINVQGNMRFMTKTFIILGIVMFIRKAPKLISDIFGIDMKNANMSLKDRLRDSGLTALAGAGLGSASYVGSTFSALSDRKDLSKSQKFWTGLRRSVVGLHNGARLGFQTGWHDGSLKGVGAASNYAIHQEKAYARGASWAQARLEMMRDDFGFMSYYDRQKARVEIGRDSEKQLRDRVLREGSKIYDQFSTDSENRFGFDAKKKANDRALSKFEEMENKAKDSIGKNSSKTVASVRQFTAGREKIDTFALDISTDKDGNTLVKTSTSRKMDKTDINNEIARLDAAMNNGDLSTEKYKSFRNYYENQLRAYDTQPVKPMFSDRYVSMNSKQIESELQMVKDAYANRSISDDEYRMYKKYYEDKNKSLHKQGISDAMLYTSVLVGRQQSQVASMIGNDYSSSDDSIKNFAQTYCYEDFKEANLPSWIASGKSEEEFDKQYKPDDFRFSTHDDMKKAILSTIFDGNNEEADKGRTNSLSQLANSVLEYKEVANDDSVNLRYRQEGDANDGSSYHKAVDGINSLFGEDILKGGDDIRQTNIQVSRERHRVYSSSDSNLESLRIPKELQGRFGYIKNYDELHRFLETVKDESKGVGDKYSSELEYLKFLEPSKEASENIKKYKNKYKGNRK